MIATWLPSTARLVASKHKSINQWALSTLEALLWLWARTASATAEKT